MGVTGKRLPPGPKGMPVVGVAFELRPDPLAGLRRFAREYGDVARFCVMMQERILLSHPEICESGFGDSSTSKPFHKSELTRKNYRAHARERAADQRRGFLAAAAASGAARVPP